MEQIEYYWSGLHYVRRDTGEVVNTVKPPNFLGAAYQALGKGYIDADSARRAVEKHYASFQGVGLGYSD